MPRWNVYTFNIKCQCGLADATTVDKRETDERRSSRETKKDEEWEEDKGVKKTLPASQ